MSASEASESESDTEYVVERIVGKRGPPDDLEYKVKWKGFSNPRDNTWEPLYNLDNCITLIAEFESRNQKSTTGKKKSVSKAKKKMIFAHYHLPDKQDKLAKIVTFMHYEDSLWAWMRYKPRNDGTMPR